MIQPSQLLRDIRGGECQQEFAEALENCLMRVQNENKAGSVTLTITMTPRGGGKMKVSDTINSKLPAPVKEDTLFFITEDNQLSRRSPYQMTIDDTESASK